MGKRVYVEATQEGFYGGAIRSIGDRFWIADKEAFSDSDKTSENKLGRKGRKGWMKKADPSEAPAEPATELSEEDKGKVEALEAGAIELTKVAEAAEARATAAEEKLAGAIEAHATALSEKDAVIAELKDSAKSVTQATKATADNGTKTS